MPDALEVGYFNTMAGGPLSKLLWRIPNEWQQAFERPAAYLNLITLYQAPNWKVDIFSIYVTLMCRWQPFPSNCAGFYNLTRMSSGADFVIQTHQIVAASTFKLVIGWVTRQTPPSLPPYEEEADAVSSYDINTYVLVCIDIYIHHLLQNMETQFQRLKFCRKKLSTRKCGFTSSAFQSIELPSHWCSEACDSYMLHPRAALESVLRLFFTDT